MPTLLLQTEQLSCKLVYLCHLYFGYFGLVFAAVFQPKLINLSLPAYNGLHSQNAALIYIVSVCPIIAQCTIAPEVSNVILVMCCECFFHILLSGWCVEWLAGVSGTQTQTTMPKTYTWMWASALPGSWYSRLSLLHHDNLSSGGNFLEDL